MGEHNNLNADGWIMEQFRKTCWMWEEEEEGEERGGKRRGNEYGINVEWGHQMSSKWRNEAEEGNKEYDSREVEHQKKLF